MNLSPRTAMFLGATVMLLVSCGQGQRAGGEDGGIRGSVDTSAGTEVTAAESPAGTSGAPLRVGVVIPESGPYAPNGEAILEGMQVYFDSVGGQVAGRSVELIVEDEQQSPEAAVQAARRLISRDEVEVLAGIVQTPIAFAVREVAAAANVPLVLANPGGNALTGSEFPNVFRVGYTAYQVCHPLGRWLVDDGITRVYVLSTDHTGGREFAENFIAGFEEAGGEVLGEDYVPLGNADYSSYLQKVQDSDAQATWAFFGGVDAVRFTQQYDQLGLKQARPLFGLGGIVDAFTFGTEPTSALQVLNTFFYSSDLDNPENVAFVEHVRDTYGHEPNDYNVEGYDAAWLIGEAVTALDGDTDDAQALIDAMSSVEFASPRGQMRLDEQQNVVQNIYLREPVVVDGVPRQRVVETFEMVESVPT